MGMVTDKNLTAVDLLRCQCPKCKQGVMVEADLWRDWDGDVTCNKCMYAAKRWRYTTGRWSITTTNRMRNMEKLYGGPVGGGMKDG